MNKENEPDLNEKNRLLEEALTEAIKRCVAQEKSVAIGNLIPSITHEINTPLGNGTIGASRIIEIVKQLQKSLTDNKISKSNLITGLSDILELAEIIRLTSQQAADLIRSFKQISADQFVSDERLVDLKNQFGSIYLSLKPSFKGRQQKFNIVCGEGIEFYCSPTYLFEIVVNLVSNSIKYAYANNEAGTITFIVSVEGDNLKFVYEDDGAGMDENMQNKIFEKFHTSSFANKGTGLGMYIIHDIITNRLKGSIECKSSVGKGAKFIIIVPHKKEESPS